MNVDLYCTQCSSSIETICTNLDVYQHSLHKIEYDPVICSRCSVDTHVVVRCSIPRDSSMCMRSQAPLHDDGEDFLLTHAPVRKHVG